MSAYPALTAKFPSRANRVTVLFQIQRVKSAVLKGIALVAEAKSIATSTGLAVAGGTLTNISFTSSESYTIYAKLIIACLNSA